MTHKASSLASCLLPVSTGKLSCATTYPPSQLMIMQAQAKKSYSPEEYLELEINSEDRHEYIKGEVIQMTGRTPNHNQITLNLSGSLNFALRKQPYRVFVTDQRLWITEAKIHTYPDVMKVFYLYIL